MKKFTVHSGVAAPLLRSNLDTDAIIPSVEMKQFSRKGLSGGLFAAWRYSDRINRVPDPDFILNRPDYRDASILLSGRNFGCGSSREHAVWALVEYGFRAIIAESFGGIFRANCIANGLLPISMPEQIVLELADFVIPNPPQRRLSIDLTQRTVTAAPGQRYSFDIAKSDAEMLIEGLDPISLTLRLDNNIRSFHEADRQRRPWVYL